ncbi:MAG: hypothetical protein AAGE01_01930 [Pseudomonadota bacterium]
MQKIACIAALCLAGAGIANAEAEPSTVLVTGTQAGKGTFLELEYLGDGAAVGVQVELVFEGVDVKKVSLSGCAAPKSGAVLGTCRFRGNTLVYAKLNSNIEPLNSGTLATIRVPASKGTFSVTPVKVVTSDASGRSSQGELLLDMFGQVQAK